MKMEAADHICEREQEVKQFLESKGGVKGLVDSGISKIPRIFIHSPEQEDLHQSSCSGKIHDDNLQVPVIDLKGLDDEIRRKEIVEAIGNAAETWGFFQIINHGIPLSVMEDMLEAARRSHEQPQEVKNEWYSLDFSKSNNIVNFFSNPLLNKVDRPGDWKDTFHFDGIADERNLEALPQFCREELRVYSKGLIRIRKIVGELLSESLGLNSDYITNMGCLNSMSLYCQYYPVCPQPHLAQGTGKHTDSSFLTLLVPDPTVGGLQVVHQNHWVDVKPERGAFIVNIGDFMQLVTNDKFKSIEHRVLVTQGTKSRVSLACFITPGDKHKKYGPIKKHLSDENELPALYKETSFVEYKTRRGTKGIHDSRILLHFKLAS